MIFILTKPKPRQLGGVNKEMRMKESDYVRVDNKTKIKIALAVLRDCHFWDNDDQKEMSSVRVALVKINDKIKIDIEE